MYNIGYILIITFVLVLTILLDKLFNKFRITTFFINIWFGIFKLLKQMGNWKGILSLFIVWLLISGSGITITTVKLNNMDVDEVKLGNNTVYTSAVPFPYNITYQEVSVYDHGGDIYETMFKLNNDNSFTVNYQVIYPPAAWGEYGTIMANNYAWADVVTNVRGTIEILLTAEGYLPQTLYVSDRG